MSGKKRSGAPAPGVFISFSDVAEGFSAPPPAPAPIDGLAAPPRQQPQLGQGGASRAEDTAAVEVTYYTGSHSEVAQITRTITKKDGVTRVKALRELRSIVEVGRIYSVP
jgi:hypothetical protein